MNGITQQIEELLNKLTREELIEVNRAVLRRFKANAAFFPGDKVTWHDREGALRMGRVIRVNSKSISVEENGDPDGIWRIGATLLKKIEEKME